MKAIKVGVIGLGNAGTPILNNLYKSKKYMKLSYLLGQHSNVPLDLHMEVKKKMDKTRIKYGDNEGCYVYPRTLEDELGESLSQKGWDNWGYDIKVVDGSIVVKHKNRPISKHPQYNSGTKAKN